MLISPKRRTKRECASVSARYLHLYILFKLMHANTFCILCVYKFFPFGQFELAENLLSFFWLYAIQYNVPLDRSKPSFHTLTSKIYTFNPCCCCCCCSLCMCVLVIAIHRRFFPSCFVYSKANKHHLCWIFKWKRASDVAE